MSKGVSRANLVEAALQVLDERGIDGLTVRAVADVLGVKPPALYWHVKGKQDLLDEMGTEIQRRISRRLDFTGSAQDWPWSLREFAQVVREEYSRHRDGARTFSGTRLTDPALLTAQEPWLQAGMDAGLTLEQMVTAAQLITNFVVGFVIEEQERAQSSEQRYSLAERDAALADAPLTREAGRVIFEAGDTRFERQLAILLTGLAATPTAG
ncbi:TetR/AcrR family transcriptional regulator C-terminal domain-containing protein [Flexivirga oryzae]|uniref:AcrR family transcriptional regulator n=1 Tax=Flexivirga oryzae TaxID=1794944 RepID=A0A839N6U7_9MICO|nr:TetR/AcrR family transcriptional regulator C-terminal domain-containing protein [Flexivirga oryzae]MBB2893478.1 AcrR family transcriptional regulator [Flexivirga oryzae]